jgi:hypothetical protein
MLNAQSKIKCFGSKFGHNRFVYPDIESTFIMDKNFEYSFLPWLSFDGLDAILVNSSDISKPKTGEGASLKKVLWVEKEDLPSTKCTLL